MCKFSLEKKLSMLRQGGDKQIRWTFFPLDQLAFSNAKLPKKKHTIREGGPLEVAPRYKPLTLLRLVTRRTLLTGFTLLTEGCGAWGRGEREFPFPSIPKNERLWFLFPNYGNGFFYSLPVPEFREWIFSIPFPFLNWPFQSRESKGKMGDFKRC